MWTVVKIDTVAVLPQFTWYWQGSGYKFYGITTVLGSKYADISW